MGSGKIIEKTGPCSYHVKSDDEIKRVHVDQVIVYGNQEQYGVNIKGTEHH